MNRQQRRRHYQPRVEIANSTLRPGLSASGLLVCHFDGACDYPGGRASFGVIVRRDGRSLWRTSQPVADRGAGMMMTCNVAEYSGLVALLRWLLAAGLSDQRIRVIGDSKLVIKQAFGNWRIKRGHYTVLAHEAQNLLLQFPRITGRWVPRERNTTADALSKAALTRRWRQRQPVG
jgi:ribonuclease HI